MHGSKKNLIVSKNSYFDKLKKKNSILKVYDRMIVISYQYRSADGNEIQAVGPRPQLSSLDFRCP